MALPIKFCERMKKLLGDEYNDFEQSLLKPRAHGLRINEKRCDINNFPAKNVFTLTPVPWCKTGFYYPSDERAGKHPYYEAGLYYIQEPSAMAVGTLADIQKGEWVLDLCAAPGGKSTHLAPNADLIVCNEIHPTRVKILSQNIERAGIENSIVTNETPNKLASKFPEMFDCVVVDAPCSGEGMFRKDETAIIEWTEQTPQFCADRQDEILADAAKMVRKGGRLVYSTCTFAPEENEGTLTRFLNSHSDFEIVKTDIFPMFESGKPEWYENAHPSVKYFFRLFPHKIEGEGHFCALLRRKGNQERNTPKMSDTLKKLPDTLSDFIKDIKDFDKDMKFIQAGDRIWCTKHPLDLTGLKVLRNGLELGTLKKGRFEPAHAFAMAWKPEYMPRKINLSNDDAIKYLKGEALNVEADNGWTVVCIDNFALGWGKISNNTLKNHFPKGLRWK